MTITENVATMNDVDLEANGHWRPWGDAISKPEGKAFGIAWALRKSNVTDLFSLTDRKLLHYSNGKWNTVVGLNGQPVMNGLAAVGVNGLPEVFVLTSAVLLHARFDGANWSFKTLPELPIGGVTQLLAVHDSKDTDVFVVTGEGAMYTLRMGGAGEWKQVPLGARVRAICGAAASAAGRREIAIGDGATVRIFVSNDGGGSYHEIPDEKLLLPFATERVLLVSPETNILYAVALAQDAAVSMSQWIRDHWGQRYDGVKGNDLGSIAAAVSQRRDRIDVLATDFFGVFSPRLFDR